MYFYKKAGSVAVVLIAIVFVIFIVIFGIRFLDFPGKSKTSRVEIREDNDKRIVVIDGVKEYQLKDKDGYWYRVEEDVYNSK